MNRLIRVMILIAAIIAYFALIMNSSDPITAMGKVLLVALLLMSMESIRRKRDKAFKLRSDMEKVDAMNHMEFMQYLAELYKRLGYYTAPISKEVGESCDFMIREGKVSIAVKCLTEETEVGKHPLEHLCANMKVCGAKQGLVITNRVFDEQARIYAQHNKIKLVDRNGLISMIQKAINQKTIIMNTSKVQEV